MEDDEIADCFATDHDLREIDTRDGITVYECRRCGAEVFSEVDD